jgi:hypothetical protein
MRAKLLYIPGLVLGACLLISCETRSGLEFGQVAPQVLGPMGLLRAKCLTCHNPNKADGNFSTISDVQKMIAEGRIVPGNPIDSRLFTVLNTGFMPPGGRLAEAEVAMIRAWIEEMRDDSNVVTYKQVFEKVIQPSCLGCHGPTSDRRLDSYEEANRYVVKWLPEYSLIYEVLIEGRMPKSGSVTPEQIDLVGDWIATGAEE